MTNTRYKQTEIGRIPEDWEVKMLKEITSHFKSGYSITSASIFIDGEYPVYGGNGLRGFTNNYTHDGDYVLIGRQGALCGNLNYVSGKNFISEHAIVVDSNAISLDKYLFYALVRLNLNSLSESSAQPGLSVEKIIKLKIPLPPLPEQTAIAAALSDADAYIESLELLLEKKRQVKQGAMQELLRPGEGWEEKKLGEVISVFRGGSPRPIQNFITDKPGGTNWIKIADTSATGKYIVSANEKIIQEGEKFSRKVNVGDFLLSNSMSFGRPYVLKIDGCIHDGWLVLQNYQESFVTEFLYYLLSSKLILDQYKSKAAGSSVLNLNKELVSTVLLSFPDLTEQNRIANILSDMDTEIGAIGEALEKARQMKQGMMQELLTGKIRLV